MIRIICLACVSILLVGSPTQAGLIYKYDDGSGESSLGIEHARSLWLNSFEVVSGGESLRSLQIAFGANSNDDRPNNGSPVTAYLWTSPSNNADPTVDAILRATVEGKVANSHTDTFLDFELPSPITLNVGDVFFAGFQAKDFAVARDTNNTPGRSWLFSNGNGKPIDPTDLGNQKHAGTFASFCYPGTALIRVGAEGLLAAGYQAGTLQQNAMGISAVPEPTSLVIFGLGMLPLALGPRRRQRKQPSLMSAVE